VWDLLIALALLWVARRFADRLKNGDVFVLYLILYSVGRFFVETLRIDPAFIIGSSFRGNLLVSGVLAVGFALLLILRHHRKPRERPAPG
jgi:phosphatidylglycerol:prolipoprotein diacylglycerol transferase